MCAIDWPLRPWRPLMARCAGAALALCGALAWPVVAQPIAPGADVAHARPAIKPAQRDPFALALPAPVVAPVPVFTPPPEPPPAVAVTPSEPLPQLTFTGRLQTPDGRTVVLALWGDGRPVTLEAGKVLGNGFRVERVDATVVELMNPQTQAVLQLPLPPPPRFETR